MTSLTLAYLGTHGTQEPTSVLEAGRATSAANPAGGTCADCAGTEMIKADVAKLVDALV